MMKEVCLLIDTLIDYAKKNLGLRARNEFYARNTVLGILGMQSFEIEGKGETDLTSPEPLLSSLKEACIKAGVMTEENAEEKLDLIMGALSLSPAEVEDTFDLLMDDSAKATEWLYRYGVKNGFLKKSLTDQNASFEANGLTVSINQTNEKQYPINDYPACELCRENEGYFPYAKRTMRTASIRLNETNWTWQFLPYASFRQHGLAVSEKHAPAHVDQDTFFALLDFVDQFPHYFIGCDAPLSLIGTHLSHDHYIGGGETLPLQKAKIVAEIKPPVEGVRVCVLDWPCTVVRIKGSDRKKVALVSEAIRNAWTTEDQAVSAVAIKVWEGYEMNLILRKNDVCKAYDEIFGDPITLIEAQGLFSLPISLMKKLEEVEECVNMGYLKEELSEFALIYDECRVRHENQLEKPIHEVMQEEIGSILWRILQNTAVFATAEETMSFLNGVQYVLSV